jgi:2-oxoglutarate dehydrogenase complex dehydrogenase (E1) component-like enzyme
VQPRLLRLLDGRRPLRLIARPRRASPAEGTMAMHLLGRAALLDRAFEVSEAG